MISFLSSCIAMLASRSPRTMLMAVMAGLVLAGACWWVCTNYCRLWNKRFQINTLHHVLCVVAAVATLVFTLVFVSMRYSADITAQAIDKWHRGARGDNATTMLAFRRGYQAVKASGLEDFSKQLPMDDPRAIIPISSQRSREIASKAYVDAVTDDFRAKNSFLLRALTLPNAPLASIMADREAWMRQNAKQNYPVMRAVDFTATHIRNALVPQAPKTVAYVRGMALLVFLLFQAIPFCVIGFSAYKDLREQT
jgi:hypothetical protein